MAGVPASSRGAASAAGSEISYDEITTNVAIVGTSAGAPTTVITCTPSTFNGNAVILSVFCPALTFGTANGNFVTITLWESGAQLCVLWQGAQPSAAGGGLQGIFAQRRFTPSSGSHSYLIRAFVASTTGGPTFQASTGGTTSGSFDAAFARFQYA